MSKIERQVSGLSSEIAVLTPAQATEVNVPFAQGFDLEALKTVDDDPFFVTVSIKAGKGDQGEGPEYDEDILRSLEQQFNSMRPPGYKGHQDPDKISWEYREPVTAWVGAQFVAGKEGRGELFVKGYVPQTAQDLRTQLNLAQAGADIVNSVSIFGVRDVENNRVTKFDLWSLDWTPKGRAGMQTELVGISGEQAKEEDEMATREEVIASISVADVPEAVKTSLREEGIASVESETAIAGEMRVILELDSAVDPEAIVEAVRGLISTVKTDELGERVDEAMEDKITAEMAKEAVRDTVLSSLSVNATEEEIAGEISEALERPYIKALAEGVTIPVISGGTGGDSDGARQGTAWE